MSTATDILDLIDATNFQVYDVDSNGMVDKGISVGEMIEYGEDGKNAECGEEVEWSNGADRIIEKAIYTEDNSFSYDYGSMRGYHEDKFLAFDGFDKAVWVKLTAWTAKKVTDWTPADKALLCRNVGYDVTLNLDLIEVESKRVRVRRGDTTCYLWRHVLTYDVSGKEVH